MFEVGLLLHFSYLLPRVFSLRGSPDGVAVALRIGDRCAIREGVPARVPRPPDVSRFAETLDSPR